MIRTSRTTLCATTIAGLATAGCADLPPDAPSAFGAEPTASGSGVPRGSVVAPAEHTSGSMRLLTQEGPYRATSDGVRPGVGTVDALDPRLLLDLLYYAWDDNIDRALDRSEWARATQVMEDPEGSPGVWIEIDVDGDLPLDLVEVRVPLHDPVVVASMDANKNGRIADMEMNDWFFALFDIDESGAIGTEEWRLAELYFAAPLL